MVNVMPKHIKNLIFFILLSISFYILFIIWPKLLYLLSYIFRIVLPFCIAFVIAYILNPFVTFLTKYLKRRSYAVIVIAVVLLLIIYFIFSLAIPFFMKEIEEFINNYETIIESLETKINSFAKRFDFLPHNYQPSFDNLKELIKKYINTLAIKPETVIKKLFDYISIIIVIPMTLIYLMIDFETIKKKIKDELTKRNKIHFKQYLSEINKSTYKFLKTTLVIMLIMFLMSSGLFWLVGLEHPLVFGLIVAVTNVIPYLGPYIGGFFPVAYALVSSTKLALIVLLVVIIIQIIESDIISPYLHGKNNDLHPVLVIFGLVFFGELLGVIGMILSVPLMSVIKITYTYYPPKTIIEKLNLKKQT